MNVKLISTVALSLLCSASISATPLTVEMRNGTKLQISSNELQMTFSNGNLTAQWNAGSQEIPVTNIASFYFQEIPSGLGINVAETLNNFDLFSIDGNYVGRFQSIDEARNSLSRGLYVVKTESSTSKMVIK